MNAIMSGLGWLAGLAMSSRQVPGLCSRPAAIGIGREPLSNAMTLATRAAA
jgi:hypothetical protein